MFIKFNYMKKLILLIILATFFLLPSAYANIVDELTKLNNLYKDGALNQEEFNKAKKILLKTGSNKSEKNQPKQTIKVKKPIKYPLSPIELLTDFQHNSDLQQIQV